MTRRVFLPTAAGALAAGSAAAAPPNNAVIELRRIQLRNGPDNQRQRTVDFLDKHVLPAYQRAGAGPLGFFASSIAPNTPFLLTLASYPSLAAVE
jgi:hypothetical protein